jgi:mannose-6-phosphate isomerase class I
MSPALVAEEEGVRVERVVSYPEFTVDRVRLESGRPRASESDQHYRLLFVVEGQGRIKLADGSERPLAREDALLLPATLGAFEIGGMDGNPLVYLEAVANRSDASTP